ncbi:hypothetical protein LB572_24575 [Mesorhizobium sp. BH1-1-5]|uniref:hypothetical protein n=1 Tax=Mesorhizobium sp. BH1-1-5 TaxID=2876661 RepID=UPI001CC9315C|nr:hypothetical protein [Mesorhizobium sp. BH1-1-5]MBZ9990279.1 hypothetical protein [Mesorhizobium sp. BH1-1-5]
MPHEALVHEIRRFNRFYTGLVGLLDETLMQSPYTLVEARVLFELGRKPRRVGARAGFWRACFISISRQWRRSWPANSTSPLPIS